MYIKIHKWENEKINKLIEEILESQPYQFIDDEECFLVVITDTQKAYDLGDLIGGAIAAQL